jgi:hypothetical protein
MDGGRLMPESYTGTEGNDAIAGGLDVMDGAENWAGTNGGWRAVNKTRDMIANLKTWVTTQLAGISLSWGSITGTLSSQADLQSALNAKLTKSSAQYASDLNARLSKTGDTVFGNLTTSGGAHFFAPNAVAAVSGYTIAYINVDGRISKGASTERVKKYISAIDPLSLGDLFTDLYRYQMRSGDGSWRYGDIAERLAENPATEPFVIYETAPDGEGGFISTGRPESVDFIMLQGARIAQLHAMLTDALARIDELEQR